MNYTPFPCLFGYKVPLKSKQITTIQKNTSEKNKQTQKKTTNKGKYVLYFNKMH